MNKIIFHKEGLLMSNYMENGFTECYPLDMTELLKSEIEQYNKETQFV